MRTVSHQTSWLCARKKKIDNRKNRKIDVDRLVWFFERFLINLKKLEPSIHAPFEWPTLGQKALVIKNDIIYWKLRTTLSFRPMGFLRCDAVSVVGVGKLAAAEVRSARQLCAVTSVTPLTGCVLLKHALGTVH